MTGVKERYIKIHKKEYYNEQNTIFQVVISFSHVVLFMNFLLPQMSHKPHKLSIKNNL